MSTALPVPPSVCTNCAAPGAEIYCPRCGEQQPSHHDYSMGHFIGHAVHELVHLDSKLFLTLRLLITQPGQLTVEYFAGRKSRYIAPLRLFLILFALFFLAYTAYKPLAVFSVRTAAKHDAKAINMLLDKVAVKKHMTRDEVAERIDERWQHWISLLQLTNIVAVGIVLALVMVGSERKLAEHFVSPRTTSVSRTSSRSRSGRSVTSPVSVPASQTERSPSRRASSSSSISGGR